MDVSSTDIFHTEVLVYFLHFVGQKMAKKTICMENVPCALRACWQLCTTEWPVASSQSIVNLKCSMKFCGFTQPKPFSCGLMPNAAVIHVAYMQMFCIQRVLCCAERSTITQSLHPSTPQDCIQPRIDNLWFACWQIQKHCETCHFIIIFATSS